MLFAHPIITGAVLTVLTLALALLFTIEQVFDVISTNLVISKNRGFEDNPIGLMQKWQAFAGWWWWTIKVPFVWFAWWFALNGLGNSFVAAFLLLAVVGYAYVIDNNYKVAWRQAL